ncbi:MAG: hypothetical protein ACUVVU_06385, partial [Tepidimonas sp.]|uniref:hypothetical protein n=1 Tax=Tepidimonas sp. TaxID=2002775 RepID=UPI0040551169
MSDTDVALRLFFWQQLRPALIRWGALAVLALCVWGAVQAWVGQLAEAQAQAQAERSAASEQLRQLEEDAALIAQNAERYQRWTTLGIIGGRPVAERRALWLQRWQEALAGWFPDWEKHVTLT